ncbi:MerR family transcriptional regulator [Oceanobacillus alkalisoli]|uniref:MerR family transcriptional regulator n=1 Tax=Oceanobacillus alkalisoli TaxID=2925113 RepID=UPI001F11DF42|nr:MerR family transcriptional regulator [Oceanobacillus alkalisoli]MCF3944276.1 MerR family transcriptional regulator [Oceanobacillus alkalisoli]
MKVKEVADLVCISVRTLHHYDEIGLLTPDEVTEAGYRIYSEENLENLQQILFFRELGFPLKRIKEIIHDPSFNKTEALKLHKSMLMKKQEQLNQLIDTIDKTLLNMKGERQMSDKEKFAGFDFSSNPYEAEARERWGNKAVDDANTKLNEKSQKEMRQFQEAFNETFRSLAEVRHEDPTAAISQERIHEWYVLLNSFGNYSKKAFKGLGEMYIADERFTKNIDQFGEGLAVFMRDAMAVYAEGLKK